MIERLFFTYILIAVSYNLVSLLFRGVTGKQLSPSEPLPSITMLATLYLIYSSNELSGMTVQAKNFFLIVFVILISRFGIFRHLVNYDEGLYFSKTARVSAACINIVGVALLIASLLSSWI